MRYLVRVFVKRSVLASSLMLILVTPVFAIAPDESVRPVPKPGAAAPVNDTRVPAPPQRPKPRGDTPALSEVKTPTDAQEPAPPIALAVARSIRPKGKPNRFAKIVSAAKVSAPSAGRKGRICGDNDIKGQAIASIPGRIAGCGVSNPVRVTEVSGIKLTQAATMDCTTAKALNSWVRNGVYPSVGRMGGGPSSLKVVAHYACRTRNNQRGAKISEHGKGRAVDIAAIRLKNGSEITVLHGWRDPVQGKVLKSMHAKACGPFGTVLGPNANKYHQDHFHFDTARYRSGAYCR